MTGIECLYTAGLMILATVCLSFLAMIRSMSKIKESGAFSGGQGFVYNAQAEGAERTAKAEAYLAQVRSMEAAWQSYLENHYAIAGNGKPSADDIRVMRATFENMYDFSAMENL